MDVAGKVELLLVAEAHAAAYKAQAEAIRAELDAEARRRLATEGAAPSWKVKGRGTVLLADGDPKPSVADNRALVAWLREHHPTEFVASATLTVDLSGLSDGHAANVAAMLNTVVARMPGRAQLSTDEAPRLAFLTALTTGAADGYAVVPDPEDDDAPARVFTASGEIVPGLVVTRRRYLSVRLDKEAKARAVAEVERRGLVVDAVRQAGDPLDAPATPESLATAMSALVDDPEVAAELTAGVTVLAERLGLGLVGRSEPAEADPEPEHP